jgi:tripartite-type tricarboxylate transporter receptor subunit TctC
MSLRSANSCQAMRSTTGRASSHPRTPPEIVGKLLHEINAALADPKIKTQFAGLGVTPLVGSSADFGNLIAGETEKWANVIRAAGIKPE